MKVVLAILYSLMKAKALAPLFHSVDIANLFLPLKVAMVAALTTRDALGLSAPQNVISDLVMLTIAAALTGLILWPKTETVPSGAGQE
jgi:hypothetical protein